MRSAWGDQGAVTAELMMLMPVGVLLISLLGLGSSVALEQASLERDAAALLRQESILGTAIAQSDQTARFYQSGRLRCIELSKNSLIPLSADQCTIPLA